MHEENKNTVPLPSPSKIEGVHADTTQVGLPIPPTERIKLFSNNQWEDFILEWAHSLKSEYAEVERCGGAGDKGRDVIGFLEQDNFELWDNYQCKHYDKPLAPSKIWIEIGKLCYYTWNGDYTIPQNYYFVAPQGVGTKLSDLLRKPENLKSDLLENWQQYCENQILTNQKIPLSQSLKEHIESLDFTIFKKKKPLDVIEQHKSTSYHSIRFGGGLPARPESEIPPKQITERESVYVEALLDAYADHLSLKEFSTNDLQSNKKLNGHFNRSREEFYSAESLRAFSRDTLPLGEYEKLQDELHDGVADVVEEDHVDGYEKVKETVREARSLQITNHPLVPRIKIRDRGGICHQLSNEGKISWVKK